MPDDPTADDSLAEYRRKRRPDQTPEPVPPPTPDRRAREASGGAEPTFVIQEHHASALHWDFRLEHDGVLVSWALPKGIPLSPEENHLAVHVEDHPLDYGTFSGAIPRGQYGGGDVSIWDHGTYECEKWRPREIMVVLHGTRVEGRYVLFPTNGKNWMIHRMDPAPDGYERLPDHLQPMLAVAGELPPDDDGWAYEFKWDGMRVLVRVDGGRAHAENRSGNDITAAFPELRGFGEAMSAHQALFDGEMVVLGEDGTPSFSRLQHRMHATSPKRIKDGAAEHPASLIIFDVLHLDGKALLEHDYDHRRAALTDLAIGAPGWAVTPSFTDVPGADVFRTSVELGMEGVVAKRRTSVYRPGQRSPTWVKVKAQRMQEVVIGGFTQGKGNLRSEFGALLLGIPTSTGRKLTFAGKVGTGFTVASRQELLADLRPLIRTTSPFEGTLPPAIAGEATWVTPKIVGEVRFSEWTPDGHLRHPVWRGLRPDKGVKEVRRE